MPDGREIAIKRMFLTTKIRNEEVSNEIDIIGLAQHQNLVRLLGCCFNDDDSFLVYEYLENKSLDLILFGRYFVLKIFNSSPPFLKRKVTTLSHL